MECPLCRRRSGHGSGNTSLDVAPKQHFIHYPQGRHQDSYHRWSTLAALGSLGPYPGAPVAAGGPCVSSDTLAGAPRSCGLAIVGCGEVVVAPSAHCKSKRPATASRLAIVDPGVRRGRLPYESTCWESCGSDLRWLWRADARADRQLDRRIQPAPYAVNRGKGPIWEQKQAVQALAVATSALSPRCHREGPA